MRNRTATILTVTFAALLAVAGCSSTVSQQTAPPRSLNVSEQAITAAPRPAINTDGLEAITWSTVDSEFRTAPESPIDAVDWNACVITGTTAVHYSPADAESGANPAGVLAPDLFTGAQQVVPCAETEIAYVFEAMVPVRGSAAQSFASIYAGTFDVTEQAAYVVVEGGNLSVTRDGVVDTAFPVVLGSEDAPTPTGLTYLQAIYDDPTELATSGGAFDLPAGSLQLMLTAGFSPAADPAGDMARVHFGIHPWSTAYGPTTGCVGVLSAGAYAELVSIPVGTLIEVR